MMRRIFTWESARKTSLFFACFAAVWASTARAEQKLPYKAFIAVEEASARSGPGENFYPTDKLARGQEVEVFRHEEGGWCAIKPPEGSFSWISGKFLQLDEDNLAMVIENDVSARVGSKLSDIRDQVQVHLRKGEVVEILDTKKFPTGEKSFQIWYKIAPPAGEFRWMLQQDLEPDYDRNERRRDDRRRDGDLDSDADRRNEKQPPTDKTPPEIFQTELDRLDLELSQMVVEDTSVWSFDSLRIGAESLLESADTALERGKSRLLLNRIDRFADIKKRTEKLVTLRAETDRSHKYIAGLRTAVAKANDFIDTKSDRYDAAGRLERVPPVTPGVPRFAVLDPAGNVRAYVTPSTGVNLYKYLGQDVGIVGQRGYIPDQKAQHVTASHITPLDGQVMR
jgi:uncharacterized protein YraI